MDITNKKWCNRILKLAKEVASWSKDESTQVGAFILDEHGRPVSFGYNGLPRGVDDDVLERHQRPTKYYFFEHAERNAIYNSKGDLTNCIIYVTHFPCADCARGIIQEQIKTVVIDRDFGFASEWAKRNKDSYTASMEMFREAGVRVIEIETKGIE